MITFHISKKSALVPRFFCKTSEEQGRTWSNNAWSIERRRRYVSGLNSSNNISEVIPIPTDPDPGL